MQHFVEVARNEAMKSPMVNHKYGAVLIHRNRIVSTGFNYYKGLIGGISRSYVLCL